MVLSEDSPIAKELFLSDHAPEGFTLIETIHWRPGEQDPAAIYARLYKIEPRS
jgi:hypothetical protein